MIGRDQHNTFKNVVCDQKKVEDGVHEDSNICKIDMYINSSIVQPKTNHLKNVPNKSPKNNVALA